VNSLNFEHLRLEWPQLSELGAMAELYLNSDPQTAVAKMRIFVEHMMTSLYRRLGFNSDPRPKLIDLLEGEEFQNYAPKVVRLKLDALRIHGNRASHGDTVSPTTAQWLLRELYDIGRWLYLAQVGGKIGEISAFQLPKPLPNAPSLAGGKGLDRAALDKLAQQEAKLEALLKDLEEAEQAKRVAESDAAALRSQMLDRTLKAVDELKFNESNTRGRLIDMQLASAGWRVGENGSNSRSTCGLFDCRFRQPDFNYTYEEAIESCVYRKLKLGRSGGEVRPGWRVN
jgi:type I restriction enzyme, R subunit